VSNSLRLIGLAVFCASLLVVAASHGEAARPLKAIGPVKSPAQFVLPKRAKKLPSIAARAVRLARRQLGAPYRWGGASPGGFDCSGLVMWVYGRLGISLPHNAAAQYGVGRPVQRSRLEPGDLLFFHGLGHVGLYIGRGRMIHAPQSGRTVEIQSLATRRGTLVGARRLI
jgi:cell wall-associated NlpC family hydrolase